MSNLILTPKISEKSIAQAEAGVYVFEVPTATNKIEVTKAVEASFKVKVEEVRMIIVKGKVKTFRGTKGVQKDTKKAMVKLAKGQTIALFEGAK